MATKETIYYKVKLGLKLQFSMTATKTENQF